MLFSTTIFLFVYLPVVLAVYYNPLVKNRTFRNVFLLLASLGFYAWGEPVWVILLPLSICVNWCLGLLVDRYRNHAAVKWLLTLAVIYNLSFLFVFKYLSFTVNNINYFLRQPISISNIALPIGISFYTFQAISYVIDVYWEKGKAQKNPLHVGLYIALFPQLMSGPIVRYVDFEKQIHGRRESLQGFYEGIMRFLFGIGKKVLLSNTLAQGADICFDMIAEGNLPFATAWIGAVFYSLQILFDFSGYSDMAIGLGKMFGFTLTENFDYPYISQNVNDFWRRWHISLSRWFRDYVYIPLGGSRVDTTRRHICNLLAVWLLTGIWHGANWTFILWGLMYLVVLTLEKYTGFDKKLGWFSRVYTLVVVFVGWTIFRSENLTLALRYVGNLFGIGCTGFVDGAGMLCLKEYGIYLAAAILACIPWKNILVKYIDLEKTWVQVLYHVFAFAVFFVSIIYMIKGTYNPFIYFNF